ncbi:MAG: S1C family serine protease [Acidimicrobiales bacterium]
MADTSGTHEGEDPSTAQIDLGHPVPDPPASDPPVPDPPASEASSPVPNYRPWPPVIPPESASSVGPAGSAGSAGGEGGPPRYSSPWSHGAGGQTPPSTRSGTARLLVSVAVLAAAVGGIVGGFIGSSQATSGQKTIVKEFAANTSSFAKPVDIQGVLAKVLPEVVAIEARTAGRGGLFGGGGAGTDAGSGMIVSPDGEILTNNHVISGAVSLSVTFYGQSKAHPAHVVGTDPAGDMALIKVDGVSGLPTVTFGNSKNVRVGDSVLAIGNALDLSAQTPTVTEGIISAQGRTLDTGTANNPGEHLTDLLQTDAPISPGNSGGPLVNSSAQVIGMNTAVGTSGGSNAPAQNIGFAIASATIQPVLSQLRSGKSMAVASKAFLGVTAVSLTPSLQSQYGFSISSGAVVASVTPGSPANNANLRSGDVITAVDGTPITSAPDLVKAIGGHKPGDKVTLTINRTGQDISQPVTLGSVPTR